MKRASLVGLIYAMAVALPAVAGRYPVADTGQQICFDDDGYKIFAPSAGERFHGQDAQNAGHQPGYTISQDGLTVLDNVTGLTWMRDPDMDGDGDIDAADKLGWPDAMTYADTLNASSFGGYDDWRLPTIKELYSLIMFDGRDPSGWTGSDPSELAPFIDTDYFEFAFGDTAAGERIIDAQYWSSTQYVSTTMNGDHTVFGVNFADGRIKGYPTVDPPTGDDKPCFVRFVRGNNAYGINEFADNADGTITDAATGLVWQQSDDGTARNWENALAYCEDLVLAGCSDWRLPDAKELQSILDYTRSPDTTSSAAIDPLFNASTIIDEGGGTDYPFYWSSTTHANMNETTPGGWGAYVAFGEALGWMRPPTGGPYNLMDVHGAGAQRSDPKSGDPGDYPHGHGPQGDVVRIYNHVRCVRGNTVPACEIRIDGADSTTVTYYPDCPLPAFDLVSGLLSELRTEGGYDNSACLGTFNGTAGDTREDPDIGDGYYYLARGIDTACALKGFGEANGLDPDPRESISCP